MLEDLIFYQKISKFQHFIKNSGRVKKFGKILRPEAIFANFKTELLSIISYIYAH